MISSGSGSRSVVILIELQDRGAISNEIFPSPAIVLFARRLRSGSSPIKVAAAEFYQERAREISARIFFLYASIPPLSMYGRRSEDSAQRPLSNVD